MLVRVLTAHVAPDNVGEANTRMRPLLADLLAQRGLEYAKLARRLLPDGSQEMLLVEEWRTPADLFAWTGGQLQQAHLPHDLRGLVTNLTITMYESLDRLPEELELEVIDGGAAGLAQPAEPGQPTGPAAPPIGADVRLRDAAAN